MASSGNYYLSLADVVMAHFTDGTDPEVDASPLAHLVCVMRSDTYPLAEVHIYGASARILFRELCAYRSRAERD